MSATVEISVFPIPDQVHFPFGVIPLHIFEPRYRLMIEESSESKRRIGITHIKGVLHETPQKKDLNEALRSNQSTYDPQDVFSAGFCEVKDIFDDGRLMIEILMDARYQIIEIKQQIPYLIAICKLFEDEASNDEQSKITELCRKRLDQFMILNAGEQDHSFANIIRSEAWRSLGDEEYSFSIFNVLQFDPDIQQEILELNRPDKRLEFACRVLNLI